MDGQKAGKVIIIGNQKGGVVKTQSTNEISYNMQQLGYQTLIIDFDSTSGLTERIFPGSVPLTIDREPLGNHFAPGEAHAFQLFFPDTEVKPEVLPDGRHIFGSTNELGEINYRPQDCVFDFKDRIDALRSHYDYILIDSAPDYNNLLIASHVVGDYLLVPTLLEKGSRIGVGKQLNYMQRIKKNYNPGLQFLGTYITQASVQSYTQPLLDGYLTAVETENLRRLYEILAEKNYGEDKVLGLISWVKNQAKEAIELGMTIREYSPTSKPAVQYQELTNKIIQLTGEGAHGE
ncbi:ParA family protein [Pantoea piersonii]|uniref:ParA family protein n=1 Tax=Pantoea piersonii TaxID=2364647 RepID=UPI002898BBB5|nr:ParA family protein [Pantoea piersonii]MDU5839167.1 ParA family protein [Pantoea sp.]MDU6438540.1 ParA family protein [Pantoea sp.]